MNLNFDFFEELKVFNSIKYLDSNHSYTINNKPAISGTQLIHKFETPFDNVAQANRLAVKKGVSAQSLLNDWTLTNILASTKGSYVHNYLELSFQKRVLEINEEELYEEIIKKLKNHEFYKTTLAQVKKDALFLKNKIVEYYNEIIPSCDVFLKNSSEKLIPLASEFIIGDEDYLVCGTIDQLYFNKTTQKIEIWDWKTNKSFSTINNFKQTLKYPLNKIDDTHLDKYSIQLNLYKYILEKNTNLKIGSCWLVNFAETLNGKFVFYECKDYIEQVKLILKYHKNKEELDEKEKFDW